MHHLCSIHNLLKCTTHAKISWMTFWETLQQQHLWRHSTITALRSRFATTLSFEPKCFAICPDMYLMPSDIEKWISMTMSAGSGCDFWFVTCSESSPTLLPTWVCNRQHESVNEGCTYTYMTMLWLIVKGLQTLKSEEKRPTHCNSGNYVFTNPFQVHMDEHYFNPQYALGSTCSATCLAITSFKHRTFCQYLLMEYRSTVWKIDVQQLEWWKPVRKAANMRIQRTSAVPCVVALSWCGHGQT